MIKKRKKNQLNKFCSILLFIFLFSCSNDRDNIVVEGKIEEIVIDNVVKKRDWCRFSKILFVTSFKNNSNDTLFLKEFGELDYCDLNKAKCGKLIGINLQDKPEIWKILERSDTINITLINNPNIILPMQDVKLRFAISELPVGRSIKELNDNYNWIFNSNYSILCDSLFEDSKITLILKKNTNIKKYEFIDDDEVGNLVKPDSTDL